MRLFLIITCFVLSTLSFYPVSYGNTDAVLNLLEKKGILLIGEESGKSESLEFVADLVSDYVKSGNCLKVGLEISSDKQAILDNSILSGDFTGLEIEEGYQKR